MKKLLLILCLIPIICQAQVTSKTYFSVADSTKVFLKSLPRNSVVFNEYAKQFYKMDSLATATQKLSNSYNSLIAGSTYTSGTGITLSSSTFSHTAHTADATGSTSLTVVALRGVSVATTSPSTGQYLGYDGSDWTPSVPLVYSAGTGISISTNTISNSTPSKWSDNAPYIYPTSATRVGIGTTVPTESLEVVGNILVAGTMGNTLKIGIGSTSPTLTNAGTPANFYGTIGDNYLSEPTGWFLINIGGTEYVVPYYTKP